MPQSFVERSRDKRAAGRERRLEVKLEEVRAEREGMPALEVSQGVSIQSVESLRQKWALEQENEQMLQVTQRQATAVTWTQEATPIEEIQDTPASNVIAIPETPQARFSKWLALDQQLNEGGENIDSAMVRWHQNSERFTEDTRDKLDKKTARLQPC